MLLLLVSKLLLLAKQIKSTPATLHIPWEQLQLSFRVLRDQEWRGDAPSPGDSLVMQETLSEHQAQPWSPLPPPPAPSQRLC